MSARGYYRAQSGIVEERRDVQAPTFDREYIDLGEEAKNDPRMQKALAAHRERYDHGDVLPDAFGYFALPELEGHRIFYGDCFDVTGNSHLGPADRRLVFHDGRVDRKVLKIIDEGATPVPLSP